jgi:hypothetical protein
MTRFRSLRASLLIVVTSAALAAGCGKSGTSSALACMHLAQARCDKRSSCSKDASITRVYGDMTTCLAREQTACEDGLAGPGTGNSPDMVEACVTAYPTLSCADFFDNKPPAPCAPTGSRANGGPCAFNGQCGSGFCSGTKNATCGACAPSPAPGDSCVSSACGHGQVCVASTMLCQDRGTLNATCDANNTCGSGLSCAGDNATTSGTCQNAPTTAGAACGGALPGCEGNVGLRCSGPAGSKTCQQITYAGDGAACGTLADGSFVQCTRGDCYTATGTISGGQQGTCKADAADGAACDVVVGPGCTPPARCAVAGGGNAGTCTVPLGATCG